MAIGSKKHQSIYEGSLAKVIRETLDLICDKDGKSDFGIFLSFFRDVING